MKKANLAGITERETKSPQGRYHLYRRSLSEALGGKTDIGTWDGGHPFDVEWVRLPPGAMNFPFHAHSAQWEMYVIIDGEGEMRGPDGWFAVGPGDSVVFPPHTPHQIKNSSARDLTYYVIADHHPAEVTHYPDTGRWGIKPQRKYFEMTEAPYYEPGD
jgi:uncharacterized cupin superfamily protein